MYNTSDPHPKNVENGHHLSQKFGLKIRMSTSAETPSLANLERGVLTGGNSINISKVEVCEQVGIVTNNIDIS